MTKIFIPVILFYGNKNVCVGFVWWFLYALLLLKIIVSIKKCYVGFWGTWKNMWGLCVYFFKVDKM